ncbi:MAG: adenosylcobinamide-phosphate synthase CbiB [Roseinatronobacter sp.]|nr:adenosylcobinamide-phosphate synthase CbiB [Roseinatronobacter sp.]
MNTAAIMALALGIDALIGWPARLFKRIGHPVTWLGALITALELRWNHGTGRQRRFMGALMALVIAMAAGLPAALAHWALPAGPWGVVLGAILAWPLIATRALHDHVLAVARPLAAGDLTQARAAVAMIVGRDPAQLDSAGVARAGLESLAENASDGIVAPVFWGVVAGLPGIAIYKAVNTMDSMIGHRTARYEDFGKFAARLDDLLNLIPARLTGLLLTLVTRHARRALAVMWHDAGAHRSPNAGWPEAAMAGALGVRLSGPRVYADRIAQEPWLNAPAPDPHPETLQAGLALYRRTMAALAAGLVILAAI